MTDAQSRALCRQSDPPSHPIPLAGEARVLIVEDETELAEILQYNLRKAGYEVHTAHDGLAACRMIAAHRPDLILLDVLLPDIDGWEICKLVRSHPDPVVASTPVIMLTALGSLDCRLKGLELGADAYIPKPYSVREVLLKSQDLVLKGKRVAELAAEVVSLRAGLQFQNDIQGLLFHELRNQMVVIGGFSSLMARQHDSLPVGKSKAYAEAISRSSEYLATLAEEFLLARSLQSGRLDLALEPVDLEEAALGIAELLRPACDAAGTSITVTGSGWVMANRAALRLVLCILLDNAVKYAGGGASIQLAGRQTAGQVEVTVSDDGPGIAPEEMERIFDKFYRGRRIGKTHGSGLGLYIARSLAEAMGGGLVAVPAETGGCFRLTLPAPPGASA